MTVHKMTYSLAFFVSLNYFILDKLIIKCKYICAESYSDTFSLLLLLESGKSKRSTVDSKVRTNHPLMPSFSGHVCMCAYVVVSFYIHIHIHIDRCIHARTRLIYRELPCLGTH